jgi:hypothetical protein
VDFAAQGRDQQQAGRFRVCENRDVSIRTTRHHPRKRMIQ